MFAIYRKEVNAFFSSLIAYFVIGLFLLVLGLLLFVFPDTSILNAQYASLDQLFDLAPFIFTFLIPAITMRTFAEEYQQGTMEFLLTKPLRLSGLVLGKYLASVTLVAFALFPTLLYFYTVYQLGAPVGNVDSGAIWGSYLGLLLLGAVFTAIGLFASALTENQIAAFALATFLGFIWYWGFDLFSQLPLFIGRVDDVVQMIGLDYHYRSVSRGVLDSRDLVYFLSLITFFLSLTVIRINPKREVGLEVVVPAVLLGGVLILINVLANSRVGQQPLYAALDLTEEKRFTLTSPTRQLLRNLDEVVYVEVLLSGEFPAGFKRLQSSVREMLEDFAGQSGYVEFSFRDPSEGNTDQVNALRQELSKDGILPVNLNVQNKDGAAVQLIYPYAIFNYKGRSQAVNFLENDVPGMPQEVVLNNSIGLLEYKFANAIQKLQTDRKPNIVFTAGQGELVPQQTADLEQTLRQNYNTGRLVLDSLVTLSEEVDVLILAKPRGAFSEKDKFKLDQYIMNGGKVLWLIDPLAVDQDSLRGSEDYLTRDYPLNLDDLLFRYGIRIQPNMVLDLQCSRIALATGRSGNAPQFSYFPYPYHLVVTPNSNHPVVKSLGPLNLLYPASIDTAVRTKTPVNSTVLLYSSPNSRMQYTPVRMNFDFLRYELEESKFNKGPQPLAMLYEGIFSSMYENRVTPSMLEGLRTLGLEFKTQSLPTRMIVVADGDIARNPVNPRTEEVAPLGYNEYERYQFANKDFLLNAIEYLLDDQGVIAARSKEIRLRLLDTVQAKAERGKWQLINIVLPLFFLIFFGLGYRWARRWRYGKKGEA